MNNNINLTPKQIVAELDRFIIGQFDAKKAVSIALRNRYRRRLLDTYIKNEIVPKNILMIGPTGVGKTEIARRLAKLCEAPFIKVEATKFTEVGYVGRDVESIIRDLVEIAIHNQKFHAKKAVDQEAKLKTMDRILDALIGKTVNNDTREKFKEQLINGELDNTEIEIHIESNAGGNTSFEIPGMYGSSVGIVNINDILNKTLGSKTKTKKMLIKDAKIVIFNEESDKLIDHEKIIQLSLSLVENDGIVFLDEIDKLSSRSELRGGEVSREGVQRDLLPLIEGTIVNTKYGNVNTNHILFIASGAFQLSKPSDLLPELQGRLPIKVELHPLSKNDLIKILKEPEFSLIKQYSSLIATEGVFLVFTDQSIELIADYTKNFNSNIEDIGARRLHTILEKLLEDISFDPLQYAKNNKIIIDEKFIDDKLSNFVNNVDLKKFIL